MAYMRHYAEVCDYAIRTALGQFGATEYRGGSDGGGYRSNVGEWWNDSWHWDCLGFVHTMVNGWHDDKSVLGGGAVMDEFVNSSTEQVTLERYCSVRGKFHSGLILKQGSLLEMHEAAGHVGLYVGGDSTEVNTAECTGGGVRLSWTDLATGNYYDYNGGPYRGTWENWGEFDRVDYGSSPQPAPQPTPTPTPTTNKRLYYRVKTAEDGWLDELCSDNYNIADDENGYAGWSNHTIVGLAIHSDDMEIIYNVMTIESGWLGEVSSKNYNIDDAENGYAGWDGQTIRGVAIKSADGVELSYQAKTEDLGWLGEISSYNYDIANEETGYAGWGGQKVVGIGIKVEA